MTSGKGTPDAARDVGDIFDESVTGPAQGPTDEKRVRMLYLHPQPANILAVNTAVQNFIDIYS